MKRLARFLYYLFQLERLPSKEAIIDVVTQWSIGLACCAVFWLLSALMVMYSQESTFIEACKTISVSAHPIINLALAVVCGFLLFCLAVAAIVCAIAYGGLILAILAIALVGLWLFGEWLIRDSRRATARQLQRLRNALKQAWSRACGATT